DRGRAAADGAVEVEQRGGVAALAVDQHQHLVGRQAAQLRRADGRSAVGQGRAREVERGQGAGQRGGQLGGAGGTEGFAADDVDRRLRLGNGAVAHAGAGDDDGVEGAGGGGLALLGKGGDGNQRGQRGDDGGREGVADHGGTPSCGGMASFNLLLTRLRKGRWSRPYAAKA